MAVPHYTYLVLKMPRPNGIITVKGSFELSDIYDKEFHKMAQTFGMTAKYTGPKKIAEAGTSSNGGRSSPDKVFDATPCTKKFGSIQMTRMKLLQSSLGLLSARRNFIINKRLISQKSRAS
jgi:hypothetical protein